MSFPREVVASRNEKRTLIAKVRVLPLDGALSSQLRVDGDRLEILIDSAEHEFSQHRALLEELLRLAEATLPAAALADNEVRLEILSETLLCMLAESGLWAPLSAERAQELRDDLAPDVPTLEPSNIPVRRNLPARSH